MRKTILTILVGSAALTGCGGGSSQSQPEQTPSEGEDQTIVTSVFEGVVVGDDSPLSDDSPLNDIKKKPTTDDTTITEPPTQTTTTVPQGNPDVTAPRPGAGSAKLGGTTVTRQSGGVLFAVNVLCNDGAKVPFYFTVTYGGHTVQSASVRCTGSVNMRITDATSGESYALKVYSGGAVFHSESGAMP